MNIKCLSPTPSDVGQPAANMKVVQNLTQNLKIMLLAIQLLWVANSVGWAKHTCVNCFTYVFAVPC